jgi:hypothetical protein
VGLFFCEAKRAAGGRSGVISIREKYTLAALDGCFAV